MPRLRTIARAALVLLPGLLAAPAADAAAASRDVAEALDGARAPAGQLVATGVVRSHGTTFHRFRHEVDGVEVLGSEAVVADAPGTRADTLIDGTRRPDADPGTARLSREAAIATARRRTSVQALRAPAAAERALLPGAGPDRLVWRVTLPAAVPTASYEVLVDARSGDVLRVEDRLLRADGQAQVYDTSPVSRQGQRGALADNGDLDSALLTSLRTPVALRRLNGTGACLSGAWVTARVDDRDVCGGPDFSATRQSDRFEAAMAYFHVDRAQEYLRSLGFPNVRASSQVVNAHECFTIQGEPGCADNSYYDPATREITLGTGGVDDGEDADVIVHEYGHAVQDAQIPGFPASPQARAMAEGFSDYFAAALAATNVGNAYDSCIAEWDALPFSFEAMPCMRRVDAAPTVSEVMEAPCRGLAHCAGVAWSGALWTARQAIGGPAMDRLVIQSHFGLPKAASFHDGAVAVLAADRQLLAGANQAYLRELFTARGLLDPGKLDPAFPDAAPLGVPASTAGALDSTTGAHALYAIALTAGRGIAAALEAPGLQVELRLHRPGTTALGQPGTIVAASGPGSSPRLGFVPAVSGTHYLEVHAHSGGAGRFTLGIHPDLDGDGRLETSDNCPSAANPGQEDRDRDGAGDACDRFPADAADDADGDGFGAERDVCPGLADVAQRDWDADRLGDLCDPSARVTLDRVTLRRGRAQLRGRVSPAELVTPEQWQVRVERRVCRGRRCSWRRVTVARGRTRRADGTLEATAALRVRGTYRFSARLSHPRLRAPASKPRQLRRR